MGKHREGTRRPKQKSPVFLSWRGAVSLFLRKFVFEFTGQLVYVGCLAK